MSRRIRTRSLYYNDLVRILLDINLYYETRWSRHGKKQAPEQTSQLVAIANSIFSSILAIPAWICTCPLLPSRCCFQLVVKTGVGNTLGNTRGQLNLIILTLLQFLFLYATYYQADFLRDISRLKTAFITSNGTPTRQWHHSNWSRDICWRELGQICIRYV